MDMDYRYADFNGATQYFDRRGADRWDELDRVFGGLIPQLQASGQDGLAGRPIFDPKATNAALTVAAAAEGWGKVPVPLDLRSFGSDWDAGRGNVLAEWQFSNYPFLWNNITRTEVVLRAQATLRGMAGPVEALVVVVKAGSWPASNSTLYFEQAHAQLDNVTSLGIFQTPIRLVSLDIPTGVSTIEGDWNEYGARYGRYGTSSPRVFTVSWGAATRLHGLQKATLS